MVLGISILRNSLSTYIYTQLYIYIYIYIPRGSTTRQSFVARERLNFAVGDRTLPIPAAHTGGSRTILNNHDGSQCIMWWHALSWPNFLSLFRDLKMLVISQWFDALWSAHCCFFILAAPMCCYVLHIVFLRKNLGCEGEGLKLLRVVWRWARPLNPFGSLKLC